MRIAALAGTFAVLAFVLGCQQTIVKKNPAGHAVCSHECIDVFHDAQGNIQVGAGDKEKHLSKGKGHVAEWYSHTDEQFTINFDKAQGTPFAGRTFQVPVGGSVESGQVTAPYHGNVAADTYNYHVCDANKCIDPAVIIDP